MATDDIVTRLRAEAVRQTQPHEPCVCGICESVIGSAHDAADEIERLRREANVWRGICERFAESDPRFDAFRIYFMAVRGE